MAKIITFPIKSFANKNDIEYSPEYIQTFSKQKIDSTVVMMKNIAKIVIRISLYWIKLLKSAALC